MKSFLLAVTLLVVAAILLPAQEAARPLAFEVRPFAGVLVPTGDLKNDFKSSALAGGQVALEVSRKLHVMGTGFWTRTDNKYVLADRKTNIWQVDAGAEYTFLQIPMGGWEFRPLIGAGIGARTYDFAQANLTTRTCTVGYGTLGVEFQHNDWALRADGRNHFTCYESPITSRKRTLNDLGFSAGFVYHIHRR